jgi:glucuronosyltransferase
LKKGKEGVVFFSLGSQANTNKVPKAVKENLFKVFKEFPDYHFIVKINEGDKVKNLLIFWDDLSATCS